MPHSKKWRSFTYNELERPWLFEECGTWIFHDMNPKNQMGNHRDVVGMLLGIFQWYFYGIEHDITIINLLYDMCWPFFLHVFVHRKHEGLFFFGPYGYKMCINNIQQPFIWDDHGSSTQSLDFMGFGENHGMVVRNRQCLVRILSRLPWFWPRGWVTQSSQTKLKCLSGWWLSPTPLKNMSSSNGSRKFPIW